MTEDISRISVPVQVMDHATDLPLPSYATVGSAGMDAVAAVDHPMTLKPGNVDLVPTGLRVAIPQGYEIQVRPRSGLALKHSITLLNTPGTIDSDYRGEIKIIMANLGQDPFVINRGDRIAQLVLARVPQLEWNVVDELDETQRGAGGFGSTGKTS